MASLEIISTADGSPTLYSPDFKAHYHSVYGALQESLHIFIGLGFNYATQQHTNMAEPIYIFEMGFGTGLNAALTWQQADLQQVAVYYVAIEAYPINSNTADEVSNMLPKYKENVQKLHQVAWQKPTALSPYFTIEKHQVLLEEFDNKYSYDAVYYDAFAPEIQPELWTEDIFKKIASWMKSNANLTTYCSKGYVQRNMKTAGLTIQKQPGSGRKREVLRAIRF